MRMHAYAYQQMHTCLLRLVHLYQALVVCSPSYHELLLSSLHFSTQQHACRAIQELCTSIHPNKKKLLATSKPIFKKKIVATKNKIEIEIEIASFCQDCRKDQDRLLLGNLLKELIGAFYGGNLHH